MENLQANVKIESAEDKLAEIAKIERLEPISGADRIELATVKAWNVVVKKGEFKQGDLVIYFQIGSILPADNPDMAFLEGKRLKTKKLRGVYSQGLAGPIKWLENLGHSLDKFKQGDDVSALLGVQKWVPPEEEDTYDGSKGKTRIPEYVPKTRERRIQNCKKEFEKMTNGDLDIVVTLKFDGTSTTYVCANGKFIVCGRNFQLEDDASNSHYFAAVKKYDLENKMKKLGRNLAIQGETIGPKINKNRHKVKEVEFYVFNIYDIDKSFYLPWEQVVEITNALGIKTVTLLYKGPVTAEFATIPGCLKFAEQQKCASGTLAEGVVIKQNAPLGHPRYSFKVISNKYLLKHKL